MLRFCFYGLFLVLIVASCSEDETPIVSGDLIDIEYNPQTYEIPRPSGFPIMAQPSDNIATVDGVHLGHLLFFDEILSVDSSLACSGCHLPERGFTDGLAVSTGVTGVAGTRSSMSLLNIGYVSNGLFWDGRINNLEAQALMPVEDPIEMAADWDDIVERIRNHDSYPTLFRRAFGVEDRSEINKFHVAKAIAQYERSLVTANSRYDQWEANPFSFEPTDAEYEGRLMFFDLPDRLEDAQCFHCHNNFNMSSNEFFVNGLQSADDITDYGLEMVTGNQNDRGKFRGVSLRNMELTSPFMHDGRLSTIEDVVNFYSDSIDVTNDLLDVNLKEPINLSDEEKTYLIAFLKMLTDSSYLENPHFLDPF